MNLYIKGRTKKITDKSLNELTYSAFDKAVQSR